MVSSVIGCFNVLMGIVKVSLRKPDDENNAKSSCTTSIDELNTVLLGNDSDDGLDGSEFVEVGSEVVVLGDQMFNVPYDLFDLPDLKGVLSLEAWNTCLNEEERFSLSAYLPDMDQQTFLLTMNELLRGENIFFSSPLDCFFQRIKGGLCSLAVSRLQEGLQMLEKRKYYHYLGSYHENMVRVFMDMKKLWSTCQPSTNVKERVCIWNKRNDDKPTFVVDLNALPTEEEFNIKCDKDGDTTRSSKRTRNVDTIDVMPHVARAARNAMAVAVPMTKPRGVLKIKPLKMNSTSTNSVQTLPCKSWGTRPTPKGVLKIKPRSVASQIEEKPRAVPMQPELASGSSGCHVGKISHGLQSIKNWNMNFCDDSYFLHPESRGENSRSSEFPLLVKPLQRVELLTCVNGLQEKILPQKVSQDQRKYSHETTGEGYQSFQILGQKPHNIGVRSRELCSSATESYLYVPGRSHGRRHITPLTAAMVSRISTISTDEHETFAKSSNIESRHGDFTSIDLENPSEVDIPGISQDDHDRVFPITYKRKKGSSKHDSSTSFKPKNLEENFESKISDETGFLPAEKAKPVKLKLKIWNK